MANVPDSKTKKKRLPYPARTALLLGVLLVVGALAFLLVRVLRPSGATVTVYRDGKRGETFALAADGEYVINGGTHRLVIEGGFAWVEDADCPNHLCEARGKISRAGESIVCLPNHLEIRVEGENAVDLVSE